MIFAEEGICELIYELVEKYSLNVNSEEARAVLKMACDLIVIILTEGKYINLLYLIFLFYLYIKLQMNVWNFCMKKEKGLYTKTCWHG